MKLTRQIFSCGIKKFSSQYSDKNSNTSVISFQDAPKSESTDFFRLPITKGECRHCQDPEYNPPGAGCLGAGSALIWSHAVALKERAEKVLQPAPLTPDPRSVSITGSWLLALTWATSQLCPVMW